MTKDYRSMFLGLSKLLTWLLFIGLFLPGTAAAFSQNYEKWQSVGAIAASQAKSRIDARGVASPDQRKWIALTNAGYAEPNGEGTIGALDGLTEVLGVSRGTQTLVEVHSAPEKPLWFAVYDDFSGYMAYLQVNSTALVNSVPAASDLFSLISVDNVYS